MNSIFTNIAKLNVLTVVLVVLVLNGVSYGSESFFC